MNLWLAIVTMDQERVERCLKVAYEGYLVEGYFFEVAVHVNGAPLLWGGVPIIQPRVWSFSPTNLGVVEPMDRLYRGIREAGAGPDDLIGYIHDDLLLEDPEWGKKVHKHFAHNPKCGLVGFGGARGLGDPDIYKKPYQLVQLARREFISNMRDAESHGRRVEVPTRVSTLDGFSLICRRSFLDQIDGWRWWPRDLPHHSFDNALCCMAARHGWETWMLPVKCHHLGGQTSTKVDYVKDFGEPEGSIHSRGHDWLYNEFRDVLPLWV